MRYKSYYSVFLLLFLITSCKKHNNYSETYTVTGQLFLCGGDPSLFTNRYIDLFQQQYGSNFNSVIRSSGTTDSAGKFSLSYVTNNSYDKLILRLSTTNGYSNILYGIPLNQDIPDLAVYDIRYHLVVSLRVINPYTSSDTLYMSDFTGQNPQGLKIAGPFTSGRVYVATNQTILSGTSYSDNTEHISCGLNSPYNTMFAKDYFIPYPTRCEPDSVFVNLDIQ